MLNPERIGTNGIRETKFDGVDMHVKTTFYDDKSLSNNEAIRRSGMLEKGTLGLHDDEDVRMVISIPSTMQYAVWKKKFPEAYQLLTSRDEKEMMQGARMMKITEPSWVIMERL